MNYKEVTDQGVDGGFQEFWNITEHYQSTKIQHETAYQQQKLQIRQGTNERLILIHGNLQASMEEKMLNVDLT